MTATETGGALARLNPEDDPDSTMTAMTSVGAAPKPGTALVAQRSSGMRHLDELMRYATIFATAGVFKGLTAGDIKRQAALCAVKVIAGDELGIPPMAAMRSIHVFDGKVELGGSLIMSLVNRYQIRPAPSGMYYKARIVERTDDACTIAFFSRESVGDMWELLEEVRFTIDDARRAKLMEKDNWRAYPRAMLFNRCASEGARVHAAECFGGPVYGAGEISNAAIDADGNFLPSTFEHSTANAAAAVMEFDEEIVGLAKRCGWTQNMLEAQAARMGDRTRLLTLLQKTADRTENSSRGRQRAGEKTEEPKNEPADEQPAEPHTETFEDAPASDEPGSITADTRGKLFGALARRGIKDKADRVAWARTHNLKVNPRKGAPQKDPSFSNLSERDGLKALDILTVLVGDERRDLVLKAVCVECGATHGKPHDRGCVIDEADEDVTA